MCIVLELLKMFVHEIMNDSISSRADVKRLLTSTSMSHFMHFWHTCLKIVRFEGMYSSRDGHFRSVNNGVHIAARVSF